MGPDNDLIKLICRAEGDLNFEFHLVCKEVETWKLGASKTHRINLCKSLANLGSFEEIGVYGDTSISNVSIIAREHCKSTKSRNLEPHLSGPKLLFQPNHIRQGDPKWKKNAPKKTRVNSLRTHCLTNSRTSIENEVSESTSCSSPLSPVRGSVAALSSEPNSELECEESELQKSGTHLDDKKELSEEEGEHDAYKNLFKEALSEIPFISNATASNKDKLFEVVYVNPDSPSDIENSCSDHNPFSSSSGSPGRNLESETPAFSEPYLEGLASPAVVKVSTSAASAKSNTSNRSRSRSLLALRTLSLNNNSQVKSNSKPSTSGYIRAPPLNEQSQITETVNALNLSENCVNNTKASDSDSGSTNIVRSDSPKIAVGDILKSVLLKTYSRNRVQNAYTKASSLKTDSLPSPGKNVPPANPDKSSLEKSKFELNYSNAPLLDSTTIVSSHLTTKTSQASFTDGSDKSLFESSSAITVSKAPLVPHSEPAFVLKNVTQEKTVESTVSAVTPLTGIPCDKDAEALEASPAEPPSQATPAELPLKTGSERAIPISTPAKKFIGTTATDISSETNASASTAALTGSVSSEVLSETDVETCTISDTPSEVLVQSDFEVEFTEEAYSEDLSDTIVEAETTEDFEVLSETVIEVETTEGTPFKDLLEASVEVETSEEAPFEAPSEASVEVEITDQVSSEAPSETGLVVEYTEEASSEDLLKTEVAVETTEDAPSEDFTEKRIEVVATEEAPPKVISQTVIEVEATEEASSEVLSETSIDNQVPTDNCTQQIMPVVLPKADSAWHQASNRKRIASPTLPAIKIASTSSIGPLEPRSGSEASSGDQFSKLASTQNEIARFTSAKVNSKREPSLPPNSSSNSSKQNVATVNASYGTSKDSKVLESGPFSALERSSRVQESNSPLFKVESFQRDAQGLIPTDTQQDAGIESPSCSGVCSVSEKDSLAHTPCQPKADLSIQSSECNVKESTFCNNDSSKGPSETKNVDFKDKTNSCVQNTHKLDGVNGELLVELEASKPSTPTDMCLKVVNHVNSHGTDSTTKSVPLNHATDSESSHSRQRKRREKRKRRINSRKPATPPRKGRRPKFVDKFLQHKKGSVSLQSFGLDVPDDSLLNDLSGVSSNDSTSDNSGLPHSINIVASDSPNHPDSTLYKACRPSSPTSLFSRNTSGDTTDHSPLQASEAEINLASESEEVAHSSSGISGLLDAGNDNNTSQLNTDTEDAPDKSLRNGKRLSPKEMTSRSKGRSRKVLTGFGVGDALSAEASKPNKVPGFRRRPGRRSAKKSLQDDIDAIDVITSLGDSCSHTKRSRGRPRKTFHDTTNPYEKVYSSPYSYGVANSFQSVNGNDDYLTSAKTSGRSRRFIPSTREIKANTAPISQLSPECMKQTITVTAIIEPKPCGLSDSEYLEVPQTVPEADKTQESLDKSVGTTNSISALEPKGTFDEPSDHHVRTAQRKVSPTENIIESVVQSSFSNTPPKVSCSEGTAADQPSPSNVSSDLNVNNLLKSNEIWLPEYQTKDKYSHLLPDPVDPTSEKTPSPLMVDKGTTVDYTADLKLVTCDSSPILPLVSSVSVPSCDLMSPKKARGSPRKELLAPPLPATQATVPLGSTGFLSSSSVNMNGLESTQLANCSQTLVSKSVQVSTPSSLSSEIVPEARTPQSLSVKVGPDEPLSNTTTVQSSNFTSCHTTLGGPEKLFSTLAPLSLDSSMRNVVPLSEGIVKDFEVNKYLCYQVGSQVGEVGNAQVSPPESSSCNVYNSAQVTSELISKVSNNYISEVIADPFGCEDLDSAEFECVPGQTIVAVLPEDNQLNPSQAVSADQALQESFGRKIIHTRILTQNCVKRKIEELSPESQNGESERIPSVMTQSSDMIFNSLDRNSMVLQTLSVNSATYIGLCPNTLNSDCQQTPGQFIEQVKSSEDFDYNQHLIHYERIEPPASVGIVGSNNDLIFSFPSTTKKILMLLKMFVKQRVESLGIDLNKYKSLAVGERTITKTVSIGHSGSNLVAIITSSQYSQLKIDKALSALVVENSHLTQLLLEKEISNDFIAFLKCLCDNKSPNHPDNIFSRLLSDIFKEDLYNQIKNTSLKEMANGEDVIAKFVESDPANCDILEAFSIPGVVEAIQAAIDKQPSQSDASALIESVNSSSNGIDSFDDGMDQNAIYEGFFESNLSNIESPVDNLNSNSFPGGLLANESSEADVGLIESDPLNMDITPAAFGLDSQQTSHPQLSGSVSVSSTPQLLTDNETIQALQDLTKEPWTAPSISRTESSSTIEAKVSKSNKKQTDSQAKRKRSSRSPSPREDLDEELTSDDLEDSLVPTPKGKCAAKGCPGLARQIPFPEIPPNCKDLELINRVNHWISIANNPDVLKSPENAYLCADHFEKHWFSGPDEELLPNAIPTLKTFRVIEKHYAFLKSTNFFKNQSLQVNDNLKSVESRSDTSNNSQTHEDELSQDSGSVKKRKLNSCEIETEENRRKKRIVKRKLCFVVGCPTVSTTVFAFPTKSIRRYRFWRKVSKRFSLKDLEEAYMCASHFDSDQFLDGSLRRLKSGAVPRWHRAPSLHDKNEFKVPDPVPLIEPQPGPSGIQKEKLNKSLKKSKESKSQSRPAHGLKVPNSLNNNKKSSGKKPKS